MGEMYDQLEKASGNVKEVSFRIKQGIEVLNKDIPEMQEDPEKDERVLKLNQARNLIEEVMNHV